MSTIEHKALTEDIASEAGKAWNGPPRATLTPPPAANPNMAQPISNYRPSRPQPQRTTEPFALAAVCLAGLLVIGVLLVEYSVARIKYETKAAVERAQDEMREALDIGN